MLTIIWTAENQNKTTQCGCNPLTDRYSVAAACWVRHGQELWFIKCLLFSSVIKRILAFRRPVQYYSRGLFGRRFLDQLSPTFRIKSHNFSLVSYSDANWVKLNLMIVDPHLVAARSLVPTLSPGTNKLVWRNKRKIEAIQKLIGNIHPNQVDILTS